MLAVLAIGVCVFFAYITLLRLNIKNKPMKHRINHQKNVICFKKNIYNKWLVLIGRKTLKTLLRME